MCVATTVGPLGMLATACRSTGFDRWYVAPDPSTGIELACAPPGVDETATVRALIDRLSHLIADLPRTPDTVRVAFHVGITHVQNDRFCGAAVDRTLELLRTGIPVVKDGTRDAGLVVMSDALFADLRVEGLSGTGWTPLRATTAWMRVLAQSAAPDS